MKNNNNKLVKLVSVVTLALLGSGCNLIYKVTGDTMAGYSADHAVPFIMSMDDAAMGCASGEAMSPLLMSFGRVTTPAHNVGVLLYASAASCAEEKGWNEELRYLRALKAGDAAEAEDAREAQKRYFALAAKRQYKAYKHMDAYFDVALGEECGDLDDREDQLVWLVGNLSGLQALNSQLSSLSDQGIPTNIASKVGRAAECLKDEDWWGVPSAMRAVVWTMVPGTMPKGQNAWARLSQSSKQGENVGVRLSHVFEALAASNANKTDLLKDVIRAHAKSIKSMPVRKDAAMLDRIATMNIRAISDRMWTEKTGHRTPAGSLGKFPDDVVQVETLDLDDLL
ncbi:hypothetical protein [Litoribrevibacter albus]|uniref:hypothetical protein n=1 Tax=Litoribrevibacter albus TaxID=1473156 RepID=UPI0024E178B6|nr:hypothetical protein [Litoribrevibacter albus]